MSSGRRITVGRKFGNSAAVKKSESAIVLTNHRSKEIPMSHTPHTIVESEKIDEIISYPSFFVSGDSALQMFGPRVLWSLKLAVVLAFFFLIWPFILIDISPEVTSVIFVCLLVFVVFFSMSFVWSSAFTDVCLSHVIVLWLVYSVVFQSDENLLGITGQLMRDLCCFFFVLFMQLRGYISANLTRLKRESDKSSTKVFLSVICFNTQHSVFYQTNSSMGYDAAPSISGVFCLVLQRCSELVVPVIMVIPVGNNGLYNTAAWLSIVRLIVAISTYVLCDRLYPPTDRLAHSNIQVICVSTFFVMMTSTIILPAAVISMIIMIILLVKTLPGTTEQTVEMSDDEDV